MKGLSSTKLVFLQPSSVNKQGGNGITTSISILVSHHHRMWLIAFLSFFTFASLLILLTTATTIGSHDLHFSASASLTPANSVDSAVVPPPPLLPATVFDALIHYASVSNSTANTRESDLRAIATVLRRRGPCNLLVFGLGFETPLWRALNHGGRTVFVDENEYYIAHMEAHNPGLEAYDVTYATRVREMKELIAASRRQRHGECRPVQNLLFSECRLAVNDLPNQLYNVPWDVILVDGPKGYAPAEPGRMAAIFSAAVMARSGGRKHVDVLVHDYDRKVERICSKEFLCSENLVASTRTLGHFVIRGGPADDFCAKNQTTAASTNSLSPAGGAAAAL